MLTVHHLGVSQSDRVVWLCEELEIPYEFKRYDRGPDRMAPPEYKALHPSGTAPIITDGNLVLGESAAIVEYIIAKYGNGRLKMTADQPGYTDYLYWFHFSQGSMMPSAMIDVVIKMIEGASGSPIGQTLSARGEICFQMVEQRLGDAEYFAGDNFTAADIMMLFPLTTMRMYIPRDLSNSPNTRAYLQRIGARSAFQRAMAKADPDLPLMLS